MILTITVILSVLVAINFLLLRFSCNVTKKKKTSPKPNMVRHYKASLATN